MSNAMSASAPVGSIIFSIFALLIISLVVLLILRHYLPLRTTPAFYLVPIFFALWLPAIVIILVPIDLASSAATDDEASRGIWLPARVVLVSWRITYWLTFCLTWCAPHTCSACCLFIPNPSLIGLFSQFSPNTPTPGIATPATNSSTRSGEMRNSTPRLAASLSSASSTSQSYTSSRLSRSRPLAWLSPTAGACFSPST